MSRLSEDEVINELAERPMSTFPLELESDLPEAAEPELELKIEVETACGLNARGLEFAERQ